MKKIKTWIKKSKGSLIFWLLFVLASVNSFAQKITEARYSYYISNVEYDIIQLNIRNDTNEKMLLWFEKDIVIQKMSIGDMVKKRFFSTQGEGTISLLHIICDIGSTATISSIGLFSSFYKIIEPQKTFLIQVICKKPYSKDTVKLLKKMIITTTPTQMESESLNIFKIDGLERLSFRFNTLVIDGQNL